MKCKFEEIKLGGAWCGLFSRPIVTDDECKMCKSNISQDEQLVNEDYLDKIDKKSKAQQRKVEKSIEEEREYWKRQEAQYEEDKAAWQRKLDNMERDIQDKIMSQLAEDKKRQHKTELSLIADQLEATVQSFTKAIESIRRLI